MDIGPESTPTDIESISPLIYSGPQLPPLACSSYNTSIEPTLPPYMIIFSTLPPTVEDASPGTVNMLETLNIDKSPPTIVILSTSP